MVQQFVLFQTAHGVLEIPRGLDEAGHVLCEIIYLSESQPSVVIPVLKAHPFEDF